MASAGVRASLPPTLTHAYHPKLHSNYQPWKATRFYLACRKQSSVGANGVKVPKMYSLSLQALSREGGSIVHDVQFPADYTELLKQATVATELALKDDKQLLEIEIPTAGLASVPGDAEGGIEMTESMQLIHEYCKRFVPSEKVTKTRIFLPEANEVVFAKKTVFQGSMFKLDYLTKPSLFEDFGFGSKIKMTDRVKPEDQIFLVAYPYFNVNEMLVVEELYEEAVRNTERKLIIFNGELDRIRTGCILLVMATFLLLMVMVSSTCFYILSDLVTNYLTALWNLLLSAL